jgi:hypothetical protein
MLAALASSIPTIAPTLCIAEDGHVAIEGGLSPCGVLGIPGMPLGDVERPYPGCSPAECDACVDMPLSQMFRLTSSLDKIYCLGKLQSTVLLLAIDRTHTDVSISSEIHLHDNLSVSPAIQNPSRLAILLL